MKKNGLRAERMEHIVLYDGVQIWVSWNRLGKKNEGRKENLLVAVSEASEFLLSGSVPNVELNGPTVSIELKWVYLHAERSCELS